MKLSLAKRPLAIAAALLLAGAAQATVIHYGAALAGSNEVPPNASPGTGLAIVDYLTASHMLHLQLSWADLLAPVSAGHIHCCALPGANAGVAISRLSPSALSRSTPAALACSMRGHSIAIPRRAAPCKACARARSSPSKAAQALA